MPNRWRGHLVVLINAALLFAVLAAGYQGYFLFLWETDASRLSYAVMLAYFVTAGFLISGRYSASAIEEIADLLPGVALVGTVLGIILVLMALTGVATNSAGDFKALIEPILLGAGTAFQPTLLGVAASVLLRVQLLLLRK